MSAVLSALFQHGQYTTPSTATGDCGDERNNANLGADDARIAMRFTNVLSFEDQLDSLLELFIFSFVEPVALGFLPFHTEEGTEES